MNEQQRDDLILKTAKAVYELMCSQHGRPEARGYIEADLRKAQVDLKAAIVFAGGKK